MKLRLSQEEISIAKDKAYSEAGHNAYFGNGFVRGVQFALNKSNEEIEKTKEEIVQKLESILKKIDSNTTDAFDSDLNSASSIVIVEDFETLEYNGWLKEIKSLVESLKE